MDFYMFNIAEKILLGKIIDDVSFFKMLNCCIRKSASKVYFFSIFSNTRSYF